MSAPVYEVRGNTEVVVITPGGDRYVIKTVPGAAWHTIGPSGPRVATDAEHLLAQAVIAQALDA